MMKTAGKDYLFRRKFLFDSLKEGMLRKKEGNKGDNLNYHIVISRYLI